MQNVSLEEQVKIAIFAAGNDQAALLNTQQICGVSPEQDVKVLQLLMELGPQHYAQPNDGVCLVGLVQGLLDSRCLPQLRKSHLRIWFANRYDGSLLQ